MFETMTGNIPSKRSVIVGGSGSSGDLIMEVVTVAIGPLGEDASPCVHDAGGVYMRFGAPPALSAVSSIVTLCASLIIEQEQGSCYGLTALRRLQS